MRKYVIKIYNFSSYRSVNQNDSQQKNKLLHNANNKMFNNWDFTRYWAVIELQVD